MSVKVIKMTWPCGCKAKPTDPKEDTPVQWDLVHCALHGAAEKALETCQLLLQCACDADARPTMDGQYVNGEWEKVPSEGLAKLSVLLGLARTALAAAEPKSEAKEASKA